MYSTHPEEKRPDEVKSRKSGNVVNPNDVTAYIERDRKKRGGKTVTVVTGIPGELDSLKRNLQKLCSAGGSTKEKSIEIQGDHRDKIAGYLKEKGFYVKYKGG